MQEVKLPRLFRAALFKRRAISFPSRLEEQHYIPEKQPKFMNGRKPRREEEPQCDFYLFIFTTTITSSFQG